jgi:hypothetical protein
MLLQIVNEVGLHPRFQTLPPQTMTSDKAPLTRKITNHRGDKREHYGWHVQFVLAVLNTSHDSHLHALLKVY